MPRRGERLGLNELLGQLVEMAGSIDSSVSSLIGREVTGPPTARAMEEEDAGRPGKLADLRRGILMVHGVLERVQGGLKILETEL
jgi:hypothetical protein